MIDLDNIQELERPCRLDTGQTTGLLRELFVSGQQMLCPKDQVRQFLA